VEGKTTGPHFERPFLFLEGHKGRLGSSAISTSCWWRWSGAGFLRLTDGVLAVLSALVFVHDTECTAGWWWVVNANWQPVCCMVVGAGMSGCIWFGKLMAGGGGGSSIIQRRLSCKTQRHALHILTLQGLKCYLENGVTGPERHRTISPEW
jgi:hypothetical protein